MANEEKNMLTTALREIRRLTRSVDELRNQVIHLSAGHTRKVSITEYAHLYNLSNACVRHRIFNGVLNAEKIGGKYYIILPA